MVPQGTRSAKRQQTNAVLASWAPINHGPALGKGVTPVPNKPKAWRGSYKRDYNNCTTMELASVAALQRCSVKQAREGQWLTANSQSDGVA